MNLYPRSIIHSISVRQLRFPPSLSLIGLQAVVTTAFICAFASATAATTTAHRAPLSAYLPKTESAEIALARSAAPAPISDQATILTFGPHGYHVAVRGTNGFVCNVERAWANTFDSINFWNPRLRAPTCFNPAAARSILPIYLQRTAWVLAGLSRAAMLKRTDAALASKKIPSPLRGAMSYMMSKQQVLCGPDGNCGKWYPHVMFYYSSSNTPDWAADLKGGPIISSVATTRPPTTVLMVLVPRWSDQTASPASRLR